MVNKSNLRLIRKGDVRIKRGGRPKIVRQAPNIVRKERPRITRAERPTIVRTAAPQPVAVPVQQAEGATAIAPGGPEVIDAACFWALLALNPELVAVIRYMLARGHDPEEMEATVRQSLAVAEDAESAGKVLELIGGTIAHLQRTEGKG